MEFLAKSYTLNISGLMLVIAIAGILTFIIVTGIYIANLRHKLTVLEIPTYGFLGKSVYPGIALFMMAGFVTFGIYGISSTPPTDVNASKEVSGNITTTLVDQSFETVSLVFDFVPVVSGQNWGAEGDKFDIYWKVNGPDSFEEYEFLKTRNNPSGFQREIKRGTYNVEITVVYKEEATVITDSFSY